MDSLVVCPAERRFTIVFGPTPDSLWSRDHTAGSGLIGEVSCLAARSNTRVPHRRVKERLAGHLRLGTPNRLRKSVVALRKGWAFSPAAKRAPPTHSTICGQGVGAAGLKAPPFLGPE